MGLLETISRWRFWGKLPEWDALPFEELQNRYEEGPEAIYKEFIRRLNKLVFYASVDYLKRNRQSVTKQSAEEKMMRTFEEFGPEFGNGEPATLLRRFADAIRRVLDDQAFDGIGYFYYSLLPTYHIRDHQERKLLAASYQAALQGEKGKDIDEALAERFDLSVEKVRLILHSARRRLQDVMDKEFGAAELRELTEGYLPAEA
jgi:hypothetical protein